MHMLMTCLLTKQNISEMAKTFGCEMCGSVSLSLMLYVSHLRLVHSRDESFHVMCGIENCTKVYTAFAAYNSHIYRYHRVALGLNKGVYDLVVCPEVGSDDSGPNVSVYNEEDPIAEIDPPSSCATLSLPSPTQAAKFLLQLREGYGVSQVAMISIIDSCNKMCMQMLSWKSKIG